MRLIQHPDYQEIRIRIKALTNLLASALTEHGELVQQACKTILAEYMAKIGYLEYSLFVLDCEKRRLQRKIELIQMAINRQEPVDEDFIDSLLDIEFQEYQQKIDERERELQESLRRLGGSILSGEESRELKDLYKELVKRLHPDLHPNQSLEEKELFLLVNTAYEQGDLKRLRIIVGLVRGKAAVVPSQTVDLAGLRKEELRLQRSLTSIQEEIEKIKHSFPYDQIDFLHDDSAITTKKADIEAQINETTACISLLEQRLATLLKKA